jgi:hypothetical protein
MKLQELLQDSDSNTCPWCNDVTVVNSDKCNHTDCAFYELLVETRGPKEWNQ